MAKRYRRVLVGTYRSANAKWIVERKLYNLPLPRCGKTKFHEAIGHIVLFADGFRPLAYEARFCRVVDRNALLELEYKVASERNAHGRSYALYELTKEVKVSSILGDGLSKVYVASSRCPCVRVNETFYSHPYPQTGGRSMPYVFDCLKQYSKKWHTALTFDPSQEDFLSLFDGDLQKHHIARAEQIIRKAKKEGRPTCVEICAGAGGQALGLHRAGFAHVALVEYESEYCDVLRHNKPEWNVICGDVHGFDGTPYQGVDLFAGGVPCPPFSVASKQLGANDERDLFPEAIRLIGEIKPKAVMLENVRGLLDPKFDDYRNGILQAVRSLGYEMQIKLLQASDYGVPQIRPRVIIVGIRKDIRRAFSYPTARASAAPTVGKALEKLMGANGWKGLAAWVARANRVAPTVVGGSKKHGGPDLGPTRARKQWAELGVDGLGIANEAPMENFVGMPKLTKEMVARVQGFPATWTFGSKKTAACRMIGNAFPPPVAQAVGEQIRRCIGE